MIKLETDLTDHSGGSNSVVVHPFESLFDKIYIINLSTRTDRWEKMKKKLGRIGISKYSRMEAVDGRTKPYLDSWKALTTRVFRGHHKLYTPGSYGYLLSMLRIFNDAKKRNYQKILVLDDDVLFHKLAQIEDYKRICDGVQDTPDWKIIYFGCCHKNHHDRRQVGRPKNYNQANLFTADQYLSYYGKGSINGSFFNGYHHSIFDTMINMIATSRVPFDTGAMRYYYTKFPKEVLLTSVPFGVQEMNDSDIQQQSMTDNNKGLIKNWGWEMDYYQ